MSHTQLRNFITSLLGLLVFCTFDIDNNDPLIMTRFGTVSDTVTIWPRLDFAFSVPVKDSIVNITILPDPGPVYNTHLYETKDTLVVSVTGALKGNTSYRITLEHVITAENGNKLYPDDAVFDFVTLHKELEPNDFTNADTLSTICLGILSPAHDTDYFYINSTTATLLYLKNHLKKAAYVIKDTLHNVVASDGSFDDIKSFTLTDSLPNPLFVGISSLFGEGTRYEVGLR